MMLLTPSRPSSLSAQRRTARRAPTTRTGVTVRAAAVGTEVRCAEEYTARGLLPEGAGEACFLTPTGILHTNSVILTPKSLNYEHRLLKPLCTEAEIMHLPH
jgi:hypothetical protein